MSKIELKENLKKYSNLDECPIRNIISRFSGKWPVIILCILSENECTRFNQIQKAIPDISPKVLSDTLKNLETDGIIKRIVYGEVPPRVEYSLTKLGLSLMPYINNSCVSMDERRRCTAETYLPPISQAKGQGIFYMQIVLLFGGLIVYQLLFLCSSI